MKKNDMKNLVCKVINFITFKKVCLKWCDKVCKK